MHLAEEGEICMVKVNTSKQPEYKTKKNRYANRIKEIQ